MNIKDQYRVISGPGENVQLYGHYSTRNNAMRAAKRANARWGWSRIEGKDAAEWGPITGKGPEDEISKVVSPIIHDASAQPVYRLIAKYNDNQGALAGYYKTLRGAQRASLGIRLGEMAWSLIECRTDPQKDWELVEEKGREAIAKKGFKYGLVASVSFDATHNLLPMLSELLSTPVPAEEQPKPIKATSPQSQDKTSGIEQMTQSPCQSTKEG